MTLLPLDIAAPMRDDLSMTDNDRAIAATIPAINDALTALNATTDDLADLAIRDAMINDCDADDLRALAADYDMRAADIAPILDAILRLSTDDLSILRLSFSLCPIHNIDYAICFDDDNPNCAQIRAAFPTHDS